MRFEENQVGNLEGLIKPFRTKQKPFDFTKCQPLLGCEKILIKEDLICLIEISKIEVRPRVNNRIVCSVE